MNGCPAERACHGWQALGFQAEQESEALKRLVSREAGRRERRRSFCARILRARVSFFSGDIGTSFLLLKRFFFRPTKKAAPVSPRAAFDASIHGRPTGRLHSHFTRGVYSPQPRVLLRQARGQSPRGCLTISGAMLFVSLSTTTLPYPFSRIRSTFNCYLISSRKTPVTLRLLMNSSTSAGVVTHNLPSFLAFIRPRFASFWK